MTDRRLTVRAAAGFFQDLDRQLRAERGPNGEPSTNDFNEFELFRVVERFAIGFFDLPELHPGQPEARVLIAAGMVVPRFSVVGVLATDGAVELVQLDIDLTW